MMAVGSSVLAGTFSNCLRIQLTMLSISFLIVTSELVFVSFRLTVPTEEKVKESVFIVLASNKDLLTQIAGIELEEDDEAEGLFE